MKSTALALRLIVLTVASYCAVTTTGCTKARVSSYNAEGPNGVFQLATGHDTSGDKYVIDPPDTVHVLAPSIKEIDNATQVVRNDGTITLNVIGELKVAGKTPDQVVAVMKERLSKYYVDPKLQIDVTAQSKFYHVFGFGAQTAGKKPYVGNNSILSVMSEVQFNDGGWPQQVIISRPARDGHPNASAVIDFTKIMSYGELQQNYLVKEGDIIYIPLSPVTAFSRNLAKFTAPISGATGVAGAGTNLVRGGGY